MRSPNRTGPSEPVVSVGRFEAERFLGQGSFGAVWKVRDPLRPAASFALKVLTTGRRRDEARQAALEEFRLGARVRHPVVLDPIEVGTLEQGPGEDERPYLLSEFFPGAPLAPKWSARDLAPVAIDLLSALGAIHAAGMRHGDIQPRNILVLRDVEAKRLEVRLLDFGLAVDNLRRSPRQDTAGTPLYLAPEVLRGASPDARADLYALGLVLYECLCGSIRRPLSDHLLRTRQGVFFQEIHTIDFEPPWGRLLERLLEPDPEARLQIGAEGVAFLEERGTSIGARPVSSSAPPFDAAHPIGQQDFFDALTSSIENLTSARPQPALLMVEGDRGLGKSRLLQEATSNAFAAGVRGLSWSTMKSMIAGQADEAVSRKESSWNEDAFLPDHALPAEAIASLATVEAAAGKIVRELLAERTVLTVDDLDRLPATDRRIVRMVVEKLRGIHRGCAECRTFPPVVIIAVSSGALSQAEFRSWADRLARLPWSAFFSLEPWSEEEVSSYLDRCLPPRRQLGEIETALIRESAGNPRQLRRYLSELFRTGDLRLVDGVWVCGRAVSRGLPPLPDDRDLGGREWDGLSAELRNALGVCAVWSGEQCQVTSRTLASCFGEATTGLLLRQLASLEVLAPAAHEGPEGPEIRLTRLHRAWVGRLGGLEARRRWRELLTRAEAPLGERIYQRLKTGAVSLEEVLKAEQEDDDSAERVLAHYADRAAASSGDRAHAALRLGKRLHARGEYRRATPYLVTALDHSETRRDKGWAAILLAEGAISGRELVRASEFVRKARTLLPAGDSGWPRVRFASAATSYFSRQFEVAIQELSESLREVPGVVSLENLLACSFLASGDHERAAEVFRGILEREESEPTSTSLGSVRTNYGRLLFLEGRLEEAAALHRRAATDYEAAGETYSAAVGHGNLGVVLRRAGRYEEALAAADRSLRLYRELGNEIGVGVAEANLGILAYELGLPGTAWRRFREAELSEQSHGNAGFLSHAVFLENRALLALELGEEERLTQLLERRRRATVKRTVEVTAETMLLELRLLVCGRERDETALLALLRDRGFTERDAGFLAELIRAARDLEPTSPVARFVPRARRELDRLATASDHAAFFRDMSCLEDPEANHDDALGALKSTADSFPARDARRRALALLVQRLADEPARERARSRLRRLLDEVLFDLSPDQRERYRRIPELKEAIQLAFSTESVTAKPDRSRGAIRQVFHFNRDILRETRLESLLRKIVDAALELTGAQRGLLLMRKRGRLNVVAARTSEGDLPDPETQLSRTLVERTLEEGVGRLATDAREEEALKSVASVKELGLRSVICVPLRARRARVLGALYLDNAFEQGVFNAEDLELAESFCAQAALAWAAAARRGELARVLRKLRGANRQLENELNLTRRDSARRSQQKEKQLAGLVGDSPATRELFHLVQAVAPTEIPVLITGESGTGKELVARAVHALSPRSAKPFVAENCGAVPATLLESALFGHVKGAFTGADSDTPGLFTMAHGGTLFLDEIAEMPIELQTRLLRVLQAGEVRPLGASKSVKVDVRVVAATNRDVHQAMKDGTFREDLYYRLQGAEVFVPPLRKRAEDIPLIVEHFLQVLATRGGAPRKVSVEAMERLCRYPWPGNVRELENEVRRLALLCPTQVIQLEYLSQPIREGASTRAASTSDGPHEVVPLRIVEQEAILNAMKYYNGHRGKAAEGLGVCRSTLYLKLKEMGYTKA